MTRPGKLKELEHILLPNFSLKVGQFNVLSALILNLYIFSSLQDPLGPCSASDSVLSAAVLTPNLHSEVQYSQEPQCPSGQEQQFTLLIFIGDFNKMITDHCSCQCLDDWF